MKRAILMGFLISLPVMSWAQDRTISPGDTIRVTYSNVVTSRVTGEFKNMSDDSLYLAKKASTISLALSSVKKIDVSVGQRTWGGRGAAIGAVTGGLLTGVISMSSTGNSNSSSDSWGFDNIELFSSGEAFL